MPTSNTIRVFVYGTLKAGFPNNHFLDGAKLHGPARLTGYRMLTCGHFPAAVQAKPWDAVQGIVGEVWEFATGEAGTSILEGLDALEGVPHFYRRSAVKLDCGTVAWVYVLASGGDRFTEHPGEAWAR